MTPRAVTSRLYNLMRKQKLGGKFATTWIFIKPSGIMKGIIRIHLERFSIIMGYFRNIRYRVLQNT